jgi:hypothetical protein
MPTGAMVGDSWSGLLRALKELKATWPTRGWSWDGRLACVSSSFASELDGRARACAAIALPNEFTSTTLSRAPGALRELAERTGGLRSGQMLLAGAGGGASFAYGLWWPWGDGMTTSLRVGLGGPDATSDAQQRLREAFGVEL